MTCVRDVSLLILVALVGCNDGTISEPCPDCGGRATDAGTGTDTGEGGGSVPAEDAGARASSDAGEGTDAGEGISVPHTAPYPEPPEDAVFVTPDTMGETVAELAPGDTMVLREGTYPAMVLRGVNGTADQPITIMGEKEREPLVKGDGRQAGLRIANSSHLKVMGLRFENIDRDGAPGETFGAMPIHITGSHHITLWRNLARHPNTYGNNSGIKLAGGTHDCLLEENELYDFHRNGIAVFNGPGETSTRDNVLRRNYINPRDTEWKGRRWGPNYAIAAYRAVNTIVENNIVDYTQENGEENRLIQNCGANNRFYGNIVIGAKWGFANFYYDTPMRDGLLENNLVIDTKVGGTYVHSVRDFITRNNSFIETGNTGLSITNRKTKTTSYTSVNDLVVGADRTGYTVSDAESFEFIRIAYSTGWDNGDTWGSGTGSREDVVAEREPGFGDTYVYVPESSPYSGAGEDGADVGANILYRYENGTLTDRPLWNPESGAFPHGAKVEGVNDVAGHSAFDVHQRLSVSPATLPTGYGD